MKIKRFFAADIRQAMRMVKEELGADAVIMSNRSVDGGVEIVAARDFDEQVIHRNLKQREEEKAPAPLREPKKVDLPDFDGDKKPLHVLSSARKRGADGSVPENPIRRHLDQYIGYAEKLQVGNANAQKIAEKVRPAEKPAWAAADPKLKPAVAETRPVQANASDKFIDEMRQEMKELRSMLDAKLSGIVMQMPQHGQTMHDELRERLADFGFSKNLSGKIANRLGSHKSFDLAMDKAREMLAGLVPIADDRLLEQGGIAALVGSTGVGKTTTVAKLAAQFILKHGSRQIALITTDNYRIGAHEQINTYGRILDVPVRVAGDADELRRHIDSFADKRLILIDTAGMSQRDMRLAEQLKTLQHGDLPIRSYLVMSATTQYKAMLEIMDAFRILEPQATILTKMDEAVSKGTSLSAVIERRMPLSFITDGQQVPEDIYQPEADSLIRQCMSGNEGDSPYGGDLNYGEWTAESHA
ncbi:flagellar biosynthesis protein FlhF [Methylomonas koyamae]|uniref:Flagellar biosynthesis protein FlhF n=1 Tax=Methylomonas koyamae TaxID=702114 RepID=A0A177N2K8_9GAMM|nr:flagellar biosynthesis protein FlhF [Methylomonas koyamae]OAI11703.1 flagellar biosynthesis protein FlhF [Methylomonas koyamae]